MVGKYSEVKHEVMWTAALPKLKITYMHHGRGRNVCLGL